MDMRVENGKVAAFRARVSLLLQVRSLIGSGLSSSSPARPTSARKNSAKRNVRAPLMHSDGAIRHEQTMAIASIAAFADEGSGDGASRRPEGLPRKLVASTQVPQWRD